SAHLSLLVSTFLSVFFFNHTSTPSIYTLSLHDALPILNRICRESYNDPSEVYDRLKQMSMSVVTITDHDSIDAAEILRRRWRHEDRKSTRLNSSHVSISYAVFCLKKKKKK